MFDYRRVNDCHIHQPDITCLKVTSFWDSTLTLHFPSLLKKKVTSHCGHLNWARLIYRSISYPQQYKNPREFLMISSKNIYLT